MRHWEEAEPYRMPPQEIADLADAPLTPHASLDPTRRWMLTLERPGLPPLSEVARPELRLAGLRIDPQTAGPSRLEYYSGARLKEVRNGAERPVVGLPAEPRIGSVRWTPDGSRWAFTLIADGGIELWVADVETAQAQRLTDLRLSAVLGATFTWFPDGREAVCLVVPERRGDPPPPPLVPSGPVVQENVGAVAPSRTYQDLLRNAHDEALFEYHGTSRAVKVTLDGYVTPIGPEGLIRRVRPSPNGAYLLVETYHRPYSYLVPYYRFAHRVEIWDREGRPVREVADVALAEEVPVAMDAVPPGLRSAGWRSDAPATLVWIEAADGGDPRTEAEVRDRVYALSEPFGDDPGVFASLELRYVGLTWGRDDLALLWERWWKTRRIRTWRVAPRAPEVEPSLLFDRSWEDRYGDPGTPLTRWTPAGTQTLLTDGSGRSLFLVGDGASPEGDRPFLDRFDLDSGKADRLWRSEAPYYERPVQLLDDEGLLLLTSRETPRDPPNYHLTDLSTGDAHPVTRFPHPAPQLADVQKELIRYERPDGVQLTATLYLPPEYAADQGPLPTLMWAYPREFKSADAASQVTDSPHRFVRIDPGSPLFWLTQGYAVLEGPTMPIVGEGDEEANDTYVDQLVSSARAAVDEVVRRGVADRNRISIGGHSYGAFMTANLLAHTDLFRAGIARSGAYNRTLTPFGFQAEERTLWEVPEVYSVMSPFMHADKIVAPLLLIHGEADDNPGTFPIQSDRFYNALKGHGATARLVMLPHESHGYRARESVMHVLWETTVWMDRYVKVEGAGEG